MGALASCGSGGGGKVYEGLVERTPDEPSKAADEVRGERLAEEAMGLLKDARSVRIRVEMTSAEGHKEVSVHMDRGSNCTGTFDSGPMQKGELIVVAGGNAYFRFSDDSLDAIRDAAATRGPQAAAGVRERVALARGKYMKVSKGSSHAGADALTKMCDLEQMLGQLDAGGGLGSGSGSGSGSGPGSDSGISGARVLPDMRWHGQQVTPLAATDNGHEMTVYVAAGSKPYLVGMAQMRGAETMEMRMSDYDKPVAAHAPDPSLVLDLDAPGMGGGASLFEV
ncbi:hypothetical protein GCM10010277_81250 [Streptomyces longisporoflavus]|uniref:hypothetical protein n=1 Tax=Streptomyces longisporoflavus TaxID=28044 RepID=UPI00167EC4E9|nr:hypothetical protein [Streptomyces longisporoflavus]GGV70369.1 hypothetical protein GCM10010277_81250 [Streptomyces longisporoflavus]